MAKYLSINNVETIPRSFILGQKPDMGNKKLLLIIYTRFTQYFLSTGKQYNATIVILQNGRGANHANMKININ